MDGLFYFKESPVNDKKQLWLARDLKTKYVFLYEREPVADENGRFDFKGDNYEHLHCFDDSDLIPPGHKAPLTIGEAEDCRPKAESETDVAMAMLTRAAERLPQGYSVGVDFGDRSGISVFGNGEVLKHECDSFDIAVEIANDHASGEAKIQKLSVVRNAVGNLVLLAPGNQHSILDQDLVPELQRGCKCRIAWDETGIRLIGTPERI